MLKERSNLLVVKYWLIRIKEAKFPLCYTVICAAVNPSADYFSHYSLFYHSNSHLLVL